jgi:hypothetical protein
VLGNYTFLTLEFSIQRTNIYADANEQILKGFLTHHGMQNYPIRGRLAKSGLEDFGVELLRALFLLLAYTQPAYGVWDRFFAIEAVRPICRHLRTFVAKDFVGFLPFFGIKVRSTLNRAISTFLLHCEPARPIDGRSTVP